MMKLIPNFLSISRIILSLVLIFIRPLSSMFYLIYIICGLSDILDGFIARKTGSTSKVGAKLDSIGDLVMVSVLLIKLYPIINPGAKILTWIILITIIRSSSMLIAYKKYKTFAVLHTYANKITGMALFLFPILLYYINTSVSTYLICTIASLSAIEELIILMNSSELDLNRKGMFIK